MNEGRTPLDNDASEAVRRRYLAVDTATIADVLDTMGLHHQGLSHEFAPFPADAVRMAGPAYTIAGRMTSYSGTGDSAKMEACAGIGEGEIAVWSGRGEGVCFFGELIALGLKERGARGALVDGGVRDVRWLGRHRFPVFARYRTPIQSIGRWKVESWQVPVPLPGATSPSVQVAPGDMIVTDEDGAIVIPRSRMIEVLEEAERLTAVEQEIRRELAAGLSLSDALARFGHV